MTAFLVVTAAVAVLAGLVGLVAGSVPRTSGGQRGSRAARTSWHARLD
jgi:hypothetical protein